MNKKAKHVVWIVVDAMRTYEAGDDRDRLPLMDELGSDCVEFINTITSAPSSVMSISAMMTSIPSYFLGKNYSDFKYYPDLMPSIPSLFQEKGFKFNAFLNSLETRTVFSELLNPIGKEYYPEGLEANQKRWPNYKVNEVLENYLEKADLDKPQFMFIWYNIRLDPTTDDVVKKAISMLKDAGIWDDSFCIVTADHGYLDPKRGLNAERLRELGLTHDILVTDDQIKIPLCVKYPGIEARPIEQTISTLDFMPTLLEYFDINYPQNTLIRPFGRSLFPLLNKDIKPDDFEEVLVRSDGRFMFQPQRVTAIRGNTYKFMYDHDKNLEEFFKPQDDLLEQNDLSGKLEELGLEEEFNRFKKAYEASEQQAQDFMLVTMLEKLKSQQLKKVKIEKVKSVAVLGRCEDRFLKMVTDACAKLFPNAQVTNVTLEDCQSLKKSFDVKLGFWDYNHLADQKQELREFNKLKAGKTISLDINADEIGKSVYSPEIIMAWAKKELKMIARDPTYLKYYPQKFRVVGGHLFKALQNKIKAPASNKT